MELTLTPSKTKTNGHSKPFFIDQAHLDSELRDQSRITRKIEAAKNSFESITQLKIETLDQLTDMVSNPVEYFVSLGVLKTEEQQAKMKEFFGPFFDVRAQIKNSMPERFIEVVNACRLVGQIKWEFYQITDGKLELSQKYHDKLINRCYFFAITENQKKRLAFAKKMVEMLDVELRQLLQDEAKENKTEEAIENDLRMTSFIAGLPCCVRMDRRYDGKHTHGTLHVNEQWVVHGFGQWVPNIIPQKKREEHKQLVRLCTFEGRLQHFNGSSWPFSRNMSGQTALYPNWYEVRKGRAYDTGKRAPRLTDHAMLFQPEKTPAHIEKQESFLIVS